MKRYYIMLVALLSAALMLVVFATDAAVTIEYDESEGYKSLMLPFADIDSGVYRIKNKANGYYLGVFDLSADDGGYAHITSEKDDGSDVIYVEKQSDGTYVLYPLSEGGVYPLSVEFFDAGANIKKAAEVSDRSHFTFADSGDGYVISPNDGVAIGATEDVAQNGKTLVLCEAYSGVDTQLWSLESVTASSLELKTVSERIRKNSISAVYALVKPSYLKPFIEWTSSDESVLLIDDDGSFCAFDDGTVTVTATIGDISRSIDVNILDADAFTWYSQHLVSDGGWRGDELKNVYFSSGVHERYIINGFNHNIDWMDQGCYITSVAMVLHNLGARYTEGYDFRFEAEGNLEIDPYVASLSNSRNYGLRTSSGTMYGNPISVNMAAIASGVNLHGRPITITRTGGFSKKALKDMLDKHPEGVIVGMHMGQDSHYIVVYECLNPYANPSEYRFQIFDSAGLRRNHADDVAFEKSISYLTIGYRYSSMISMTVVDIVPEEE